MPAAPGPNSHSSDDKCIGSRGIKDSLEELIELGFELPKAYSVDTLWVRRCFKL